MTVSNDIDLYLARRVINMPDPVQDGDAVGLAFMLQSIADESADILGQAAALADARPYTVSFMVSDPNGAAITVGDGKFTWTVPPAMDNRTLTAVFAALTTASTSGVPLIQLASIGGAYDFLSTRLSIDANELTSGTAAAAYVIDTASSHNIIHTGDRIRVDIDAAGTGAKGLQLTLTFA